MNLNPIYNIKSLRPVTIGLYRITPCHAGLDPASSLFRRGFYPRSFSFSTQATTWGLVVNQRRKPRLSPRPTGGVLSAAATLTITTYNNPHLPPVIASGRRPRGNLDLCDSVTLQLLGPPQPWRRRLQLFTSFLLFYFIGQTPCAAIVSSS